MADQPLVVLRADASSAIGLGHVMRSRTLALAFGQLGCRAELVGSALAASPEHSGQYIAVRTEAPDGSLGDAQRIVARRPNLVIVDGYHFSSEFYGALDAAGIRYAIVDDNVETFAVQPAAILNPNAHATSRMYRQFDQSALRLLGLRYALIRPEIGAMRETKPTRSNCAVFVAMGGSDTRRLTLPIANLVTRAGLRAHAALGSEVDGRHAVAIRLAQNRAHLVAPEEYEFELATARIAVLAAGSSIWEAAALGTPSVAVVVAENQRLIAASAHRLGLTECTIDAEDGQLSKEDELRIQRALVAHRSHVDASVIDLDGAIRAAEQLLNIAQ